MEESKTVILEKKEGIFLDLIPEEVNYGRN